MRRSLAALLVLLCLSPGLLWRDPPFRDNGPQPLHIRPLSLPPETRLSSRVTVAGVWQLRSESTSFGGYSSLMVLPKGQLLAISDRGRFLRFGMPTNPPVRAMIGPVAEGYDVEKRLADAESATRDPVSGAIWLGYEGSNSIRRYGPDLLYSEAVQPAEMRKWPSNRGPESLVRLSDGRFIVLSEALDDGEPPFTQGLLFPGDPVEGAVPIRFRFVPPHGFRPTDMAQLPNGRVAILLRRLRFGLPWLASQLVIADPETIASGQVWEWQPLTQIGSPVPPENYEGLAVEPGENGVVRLWLISDDNNNTVLQRTLVVALDWKP